MRVTRHRSRSVPLSGSYVISTNGVPGAPFTVSTTIVSSCNDSIGRPVIDSNFNSSQVVRTLVANGFASGPTITNQVAGIQFNSFPLTIGYAGLNTSYIPYSGGWYADVIARTNPSRPVVTPLSLIQDCYELPAMLRDVGRLLRTPSRILSPKDLGNKHLAVQFGWLPLVDDINKLLNLQTLVSNRRRELARLYSGPGLRRKLTIAEDVQFGKYEMSYSVGVGSLTFPISVKISRRVWATIHWQPDRAYPDVTADIQSNQFVRRLVLGLTPEGLVKGAWDVLPWSWLIGWFTSLGSELLASSNTVPAVHSEACLMNEWICDVACSGPVITQGVSSSVVTSGFYRESYKNRTVSGALTPGFKIPFVGVNQLSILSSLFVQRFVR